MGWLQVSGESKAVFLSYASEDSEAAQRIADALQKAGVEVWFDRSALRGGDAWDNTIRRQIKSCALFIPILSENSHRRSEGYFRLEWKLAVDRSHLMAHDKAFLVPVVIDETTMDDHRVPDRFREVQWISAPGGVPSSAFVEHVDDLLSREAVPGRRLAADEMAGAVSRTAPASPSNARRRRPVRGLAVAAAVAVAALALGAWYLTHSRSTPIVPYSAEDRRMTFAVLPFQFPPDDSRAQQAARATAEAFTTELEADTRWAQATSAGSVEEEVAHHTAPRDIAKALNVHFLIRGTLARAGDGYDVNLATLDGSTEHVLGTESLKIPANALVPRWKDDVTHAVGRLVYFGLQAEVKAVRNKPASELDVRDLSFRAFYDWSTHRGTEAKDGYESATQLLERALKLEPDDRLATYLMAEINLCDCVMAWSHDVEAQKKIGSAYLEKSLRIDPDDLGMRKGKVLLLLLHGRIEEASVLTDTLLAREPENSIALRLRAIELIRSGRAREAVPIADGLFARYPDSQPWNTALAADAHFAVGDYAGAAKLANNAIARLSDADLRDPIDGPVRLTLVAAEANLGHMDRAHAALTDFYAAVPHVDTVAAIRKWIYPTSNLYGFEPLFSGLKLAGVRE